MYESLIRMCACKIGTISASLVDVRADIRAAIVAIVDSLIDDFDAELYSLVTT